MSTTTARPTNASRAEKWTLTPCTCTPLHKTDAECLTALLDTVAREAAESEREAIVKRLESLAQPAHTYASENADLYRGYDNGIAAALKIVRARAAGKVGG